MNRLARIRGYRVAGIGLVLLFTTAQALGQQDHPELPDGFTYVGQGVVEGRDRLILTSPTSAVLLSIVPDGTEVHRGDLVAAIDDSRLNSSLTRQQTATKQAADSSKRAAEQLETAQQVEAIEVKIAAQTVRLAQLNRELELGENGRHEQLVATARDQRDRAKAQSELLTTYLETLKKSGEARLSEISEAQLKLISARSDLRQAEMQLGHLQGPTKAQLESQHELAVLRAEADALKAVREQQKLRRTAETNALNRKNVLTTLTNKLKEIEEQIAQCQLFAPQAGVVQHFGGLAQGAPVRSGQTLFSIVNTDTLVVRALVDERLTRQVTRGQDATLCFDHGQQFYRGVVKEVSPTLDGASLLQNVRQYSVTIELKPPFAGVRLGMLTHVGIHIGGESD